MFPVLPTQKKFYGLISLAEFDTDNRPGAMGSFLVRLVAIAPKIPTSSLDVFRALGSNQSK